MHEVNIHQAKTNLSRLLLRVMSGEEIIIAKAGKQVAKLVTIKGSPQPRVFGQDRGKIWIADDFDTPLPEEVLRTFSA